MTRRKETLAHQLRLNNHQGWTGTMSLDNVTMIAIFLIILPAIVHCQFKPTEFLTTLDQKVFIGYCYSDH